MKLVRAIDRERLRRWWRSPEGDVFRVWISRRLAAAGEFLSSESLDLSIPANQTKASRFQGECRPLRNLLDEQKLLDELEFLVDEPR
jgi:hypothetical protein